jgi:hypothetical protein
MFMFLMDHIAASRCEMSCSINLSITGCNQPPPRTLDH